MLGDPGKQQQVVPSRDETQSCTISERQGSTVPEPRGNPVNKSEPVKGEAGYTSTFSEPWVESTAAVQRNTWFEQSHLLYVTSSM